MDWARGKKVYLVEGLPPLPKKTVEKIQRGEFVELADFPVFDGGRREGEWSAEHQDKGGRFPGRQSGEMKRNGPNEVLQVSWWGTCFTLYEQARLETNPEMARQLCDYREAIVETVRCHRWENVARHDRCFRLAAAGKPGMAWDKIDAALLMREVTTLATIAGTRPSGPGNRGVSLPIGRAQERKETAGDLLSV